MREYKNKSIVSGLSVDDVLKLKPNQLEEMSDSDLRKVVGRLVSAGNKRLRRFEKRGENSPAYRRAMQSGGKFSTKGKDRDALLNELQRARIFFKDETSSLKRWREVKVEYSRGIGVNAPDVDENGEYSYNEPEEEYIDFDYMNGNNDFSRAVWAMFDRLQEIDPTIANVSNKYLVAQTIADMVIESGHPLNSIHEMTYNIYDRLVEMEKEMEATNEEFENSVSRFFD